jgi:uncharacterized protein (DUF1810 family)
VSCSLGAVALCGQERDEDMFELERFVDAQDETYDCALGEIRAGRKRSHWMWFIFPQLAGLGRSEMAHRYALRSIEEARAYLAHPVLGERLRTCVEALQALAPNRAEDVFGPIDAKKLCSSLTLFARAAPDEPLFAAALDRWFRGQRDSRTIALLETP